MKFTHASGSRPLAGYTIKRGIGVGGFGDVYFAVSDAGKEVALKHIQRNLEIEMRGVSHCLNLKHPNLLAIHDIRYDDAGEGWIVMELVNGESLREVIARHPHGMPIEQVRFWLHGMLAGCAYLHDRGIVHRDLKPGNIFLDEGIVKIGDYGLAKFISVSRRSAQTESVGTFHYMAPEIGRGKYGKEIDVYALGVILFEMLTGRVPFDGESTAEIMMKHLTANVDANMLPEPYRSAVRQSMEKDPQRRIGSVPELAAVAKLPAISPSLAGSSSTVGEISPPQFAHATAYPHYSPAGSAPPGFAGILLHATETTICPAATIVLNLWGNVRTWWQTSTNVLPLKILAMVLGSVVLVGGFIGVLVPLTMIAFWVRVLGSLIGPMLTGAPPARQQPGVPIAQLDPVARFVLGRLDRVRQWWNRTAIMLPLRILLLALAFVLVVALIGPLLLAAAIYPVYLLIRAVSLGNPLPSSPAAIFNHLKEVAGFPRSIENGAAEPRPLVATLVPPVAQPVYATAAPPVAKPIESATAASATAAKHPGEGIIDKLSGKFKKWRGWKNNVRDSLISKPTAQRSAELLGSMLMSALVCAVLGLVMMVVAHNGIERKADSWIPVYTWMTVVSILGAWGILACAKFWEGHRGETSQRRFALLMIGLSLGAAAFGVTKFLLMDVPYLTPPFRSSALQLEYLYDGNGMPQWPAYLGYYAGLLVVLRWWRLADPLRNARVSFWATVGCVLWALILTRLWPMPRAEVIAGMIAISVQMSATWLSPAQRQAIAAG